MAKHVFFAIPAYTGQIHVETFRSVTASVVELLQRGDRITIWDEIGKAMIAHCRDLMLAHFLASKATHCVMIDHDVGFSTQSLLRLVDAPVDFVAGVYPQRRDPLHYSVQWDLTREELWVDPSTQLLEVNAVPAGFMCLSRACVQAMVAAYPDKLFHDEAAPNASAHALFDNIHEGTSYYGEDFSFCRRWRDIGGKIWIDPEMELIHVGDKRFIGKIGDWLKSGAWATSGVTAEAIMKLKERR